LFPVSLCFVPCACLFRSWLFPPVSPPVSRFPSVFSLCPSACSMSGRFCSCLVLVPVSLLLPDCGSAQWTIKRNLFIWNERLLVLLLGSCLAHPLTERRELHLDCERFGGVIPGFYKCVYCGKESLRTNGTCVCDKLVRCDDSISVLLKVVCGGSDLHCLTSFLVFQAVTGFHLFRSIAGNWVCEGEHLGFNGSQLIKTGREFMNSLRDQRNDWTSTRREADILLARKTCWMEIGMSMSIVTVRWSEMKRLRQESWCLVRPVEQTKSTVMNSGYINKVKIICYFWNICTLLYYLYLSWLSLSLTTFCKENWYFDSTPWLDTFPLKPLLLVKKNQNYL